MECLEFDCYENSLDRLYEVDIEIYQLLCFGS